MSERTKHILMAIAAFFAAFAIYEIFRVIKAGVTDVKKVLLFPFQSLASIISGGGDLLKAGSDYVAGIGSDVSAVASLPGLLETQNSLDATITSSATSDWQPGGRLYNGVLQSQGKAAADRAWAAVQEHLNAMNSQDSTWNFLTSW